MDPTKYLQIIEQHIPIHTYRFDESGWDNFAVIINNEWLFRFPRKEEYAQKIPREQQLYHWLRPRLQTSKVSIPEYHILYEDSGVPLCSYYKIIHGERLTSALLHSLPLYKQEKLAKQLALYLAALHSCNILEARQWGFQYEQTVRYWKTMYQKLTTHAFSHLTRVEQDKVTAIFEMFLLQMGQSTLPKAMLHADLTHTHILFNNDSSSLTGIIDMGDGQIGDPAFDFAGLYWDYGDSFTRTVFSYYKENAFTDDTFYNRVASFYSFSPILHDILFGAEEKKKAIFEKNIIRLKQLLHM
ncbi:aminoglycoside phosphotransferase family protein [Bacillus sp. 165]|uniref:aminoglycoside phosphotransferase family protein n=1 Tax=Bacillus sp. 165 TaxID=1529117 RepID=UPI001ADA7076|nr:aminoglycoside phosphotransferase family protein [Bacillus sp. 165]MBO9128409.1 aminoglycoside phosphotransferase family protein [Bacillus sp. 165]